MLIGFTVQATEEEIEEAKMSKPPAKPAKPQRTSAKAKAVPKTAAVQGVKSDAATAKVPPATPPSAQKSPNPVPPKRLKGKQAEPQVEKDPQEIIKELQEAAPCCQSCQDCFWHCFFSICCSSVSAVLST